MTLLRELNVIIMFAGDGAVVAWINTGEGSEVSDEMGLIEITTSKGGICPRFLSAIVNMPENFLEPIDPA